MRDVRRAQVQSRASQRSHRRALKNPKKRLRRPSSSAQTDRQKRRKAKSTSTTCTWRPPSWSSTRRGRSSSTSSSLSSGSPASPRKRLNVASPSSSSLSKPAARKQRSCSSSSSKSAARTQRSCSSSSSSSSTSASSCTTRKDAVQYVHQLERAAAAGERHASKRWQRWSKWALGASALVSSAGALAVQRFNEAAPVFHAWHSHKSGREVTFFLRPAHFQSLTLSDAFGVKFADGGTLQGQRLLVHALCSNKVVFKRCRPNNRGEEALVVCCAHAEPALQFVDFAGREDDLAWELEFVRSPPKSEHRHWWDQECSAFRMKFCSGTSTWYLALLLHPENPPTTALIRPSQVHCSTFDACFFLDPTQPIKRLSAFEKIAFQLNNRFR